MPRMKLAIGTIDEAGPRILRQVDITRTVLQICQDQPDKVQRWRDGKQPINPRVLLPVSELTPEEDDLARRGLLFLGNFHRHLESFIGQVPTREKQLELLERIRKEGLSHENIGMPRAP